MPTGTGLITAAGQPLQSPETVAGYTPSIAQAKEASSVGYDPKAVVVDDRDLVSGNLAKITAADSKLLQQARTRANAFANSRGLINSSIAAGAGEAAVVDAALPIAQGDAQTYFTAKNKTVDAQNAALNFGAAAKNTASLTNAGLGTDVAKANAGMINEAKGKMAEAANTQYVARLDANTRKDIAHLDANTRLQLGQLDASTRMQVANLEAKNRLTLQTNQSAAQMFQQTVTDITNISTNPNMTPEAKDAATKTAVNLLQKGLDTVDIQGLNLSQYFEGLTFGSHAGSQQVTQSNFDAARYLRDHPDVAQNWGGTPWDHYLQYGRAAGYEAFSR